MNRIEHDSIVTNLISKVEFLSCKIDEYSQRFVSMDTRLRFYEMEIHRLSIAAQSSFPTTTHSPRNQHIRQQNYRPIYNPYNNQLQTPSPRKHRPQSSHAGTYNNHLRTPSSRTVIIERTLSPCRIADITLPPCRSTLHTDSHLCTTLNKSTTSIHSDDSGSNWTDISENSAQIFREEFYDIRKQKRAAGQIESRLETFHQMIDSFNESISKCDYSTPPPSSNTPPTSSTIHEFRKTQNYGLHINVPTHSLSGGEIMPGLPYTCNTGLRAPDPGIFEILSTLNNDDYDDYATLHTN